MFDDDDFDENRANWGDLPVYKKAEAIYDIVMRIEKIDAEEEEGLSDYERDAIATHIDYMVENASIIPAKIAGAVSADLYDIQMENAVIIRKSARELLTDSTGLVSLGFKDVDYLEILRNEVDEFRILFAEWVKTFDPENYSIDRWGLFNPPGVNYDDHDPDDDLPFDPLDFFNDDDD
ncbi:hypothetical protein [Spongiivirga citrea]|uniref:Uncharacterized protein n=1 Tax=Spongiivirga citrea TaxID=1481457 RepID=A0A6M0CFM2_9FLAO|nr:hypothetical protein [Spongiivirga citrea]NER16242.1 hypothetical protein [Spongiivirga citrea]